MSHLIEVLETIKGTGVGLYIDTQALDTTTPAGRAMFQMLGVFAEPHKIKAAKALLAAAMIS
jgi:DNA invertase Pin-like site-specific DNA recombinase